VQVGLRLRVGPVVEGALRVVAGQFGRNCWMHTRMASLYMDFCYMTFSWHANDYQKKKIHSALYILLHVFVTFYYLLKSYYE
jgi:hypothetical protein